MNLEQAIEDEEGIFDLSAPVILHITRIDLQSYQMTAM